MCKKSQSNIRKIKQKQGLKIENINKGENGESIQWIMHKIIVGS